ncbi:MAG: ABC transporter ATP-binding protein [Mycetocola sp.]
MTTGLTISNLTITTHGTTLLSDVSARVPSGARVGLIGESGSGKSLTLRAILGLLPAQMSVSGQITWNGTELVGAPERTLAGIRGRQIGIVLQDPSTALDPLRRIGPQIVEGALAHSLISRGERRDYATELAAEVGLPDPERIIRRYPHELSGGQRQRVQIAAALSAQPSLLLADEPTTALDTVVQARILELLHTLSRARGLSTLFVTHDLAVLRLAADTAYVLDAGRVVEEATVPALLHTPASASARALREAAQATAWQGVHHD